MNKVSEKLVDLWIELEFEIDQHAVIAVSQPVGLGISRYTALQYSKDNILTLVREIVKASK